MSYTTMDDYEQSDYEQTPIDSTVLLDMVRANPIIYDNTERRNHNPDALKTVWKDISTALNAPVSDCKSKWHSLRSSYSRYLKDESKKTSRGWRKKWYLAEKMSFLDEHIGVTRKWTVNINPNTSNCSEHEAVTTVETVFAGAVKNEADESFMKLGTDGSLTPQSSELNDLEEMVPHKKSRKIGPEVLPEPVAVYFNTSAERKRHVEEDPMVCFFKSLLSDINKLNDRNKRGFKSAILQSLNSYLDQQEEESNS